MASRQKPILKELACPNCGSSISQRNATSQTLVCTVCNSHVDVKGEMLSKGQKMPPPPKPIKLGDTGVFRGVPCTVIGRVAYEGWGDGERWKWTEWLLGAADGRMFWLSYDDEAGFVIFHKKRIRYPFDVMTVVNLPVGDKKHARVKEKYPARITGAEGELTWQAKQGDRVNMIEAAGNGLQYSLQLAPDELEMYEGAALEETDVAKAFNNQQWLKQSKNKRNFQQLMFIAGAASFVFAVAAFVLVAVYLNSGTRVEQRTVALSTTNNSAVIPFEVTSTGRPVMLKLESNSIPANTWAELDIWVESPTDIDALVGSKEFWHETGSDSDGSWDESDYSQTARFVPSDEGMHNLRLEFANSSGISGINVKVEIYRNNVLYTWLACYGVLTTILGFAFFAFSNPKGSSNLISSVFEDD